MVWIELAALHISAHRISNKAKTHTHTHSLSLSLSLSLSPHPRQRAAPLPWPAYTSDGFIFAIRSTLPLVLILSFIYSVVTLVRMVVDEKEKRLKEAMAMMGLSPVINWTAWFIRAIVMMFFSIVLMIIIFQIGEFTEYSDVAVMFVFLLLFALSTICFCFLIRYCTYVCLCACACVCAATSLLPPPRKHPPNKCVCEQHAALN